MSRYTGLPILNVPFLRPMDMMFDTKGGGIDGGKNSLSQTITIGLTGGPTVLGSYKQCRIFKPDQFSYINWLGARLNDSHRYINVPIITDYAGLFPLGSDGVRRAIIDGIPHSDGALFSDDSGYSQITVTGTVSPAALNAGQVSIRIIGAGHDIGFSEWFSIYHPEKGWRAYRNWDIISKTGPSVADRTYTLAISPPLRETITATTEVRISRPLCVMKLPSGFTIPFAASGYWRNDADLMFEEAF